MSDCKNIKIAVVCEANPAKNPRPNRIISYLKKHYCVVAIGRNAESIDGVEVLSYDMPKKRTKWQEFLLYVNVFLRRYQKLIWIESRKKIAKHLQANEFDIIFCHDLILLPIVLDNKKGAKIIFDAREFYPREREDSLRWRILFQNFNHWLCGRYLPCVDYCYTVSYGLAKEYKTMYDIEVDVVMSLPQCVNIAPTKTADTIKIIHHGMASPDRSIHLMIETMDYVDDRFTLDLMLVPTSDKKYFQKLEEMASTRQNVNIIKPVSFENIIPFCNDYDIGLYILPHTSFNTANALPNKFFEFIQARLAIAIGPSPEMARLVDEYKLGIVSKSFEPTDMAKELNSLTKEQITKYKQNADVAARELNVDANSIKIESIIKELVCQKY